MQTNASSSTDGTRPAAGPRRSVGFIAAAALLILIAAIGVLVAVADGDGSPPAQSPGPASSGPMPGGEPVPQRAPDGIRWELYQGVALPYSDTDGPAVVNGPVARGFSRNPVGALLAGEHIGYRHFISPDGGWRRVTELQVLPGPGRDRYLDLRSRAGDAPPEGGFGQIAGFRFVTFSPDVAVIQFVSRFAASGNLQVITSTLRWVDDDWRLELHVDGSETPSVQTLTSLSAFIPWSGY